MTDTSEMVSLLTRDGHISELSFDRMELGELNPEEVAFLGAHLEGCEQCQALQQGMHAFDASHPIGPPAKVRSVRPPLPPRRREPHLSRRAGGRRRWSVAAVSTLAVSAAAVALVIWTGDTPPEMDDGILLKGSALQFEVFVSREGESVGLDAGDTVHPGERLGFRIQAREAGHVMIVGIDGSASPYLCYPQDSGQRAARTDAMVKPKSLDQAVRLDDVPGNEQLLFIYCPEAFHYNDIQSALPAIPDGCQSKGLTIAKKSR